MTRVAAPADEGRFVKLYPSILAADAACQRARTARDAGVATPAVLGRPGPRAVAFERVGPAGPPDLTRMLAVLQPLNAMPAGNLMRLDPFRRILPRLGMAPPSVGGLVADLLARDAGCHWPPGAVVHGDFHPGQTLCDATGKVWLVDLDDLALAPPEADHGNLAAWLATREQGPLFARVQLALAQMAKLAPDANPTLTGHFCRIALVRRALKLAERGQPWALRQLPLQA